jgi:hypothetical protein
MAMRARSVVVAGMLAVGAIGVVPVATAQPVGTFRWQLQPFCNVLTLAVVQQGTQFQLTGTDDQCSAATRASVVGLAFQNPDGSVGFGLSIVTAPGGVAVHVDAAIALPSLGGTWRDSAGHSGALVFTTGSGSGVPRPVPSGGLAPGSVTTGQIAAVAVTGDKVAPNALTGGHVADGSLTMTDLANGPRAAFASGQQFFNLAATASVVRTVTVIAPTAGRVIANVSGVAGLLTNGHDFGRCGLTTGTSIDAGHLFFASDGSLPASVFYAPFAATRGFEVGPGPITVSLVCSLDVGFVQLSDTSLTAMYFGTP